MKDDLFYVIDLEDDIINAKLKIEAIKSKPKNRALKLVTLLVDEFEDEFTDKSKDKYT